MAEFYDDDTPVVRPPPRRGRATALGDLMAGTLQPALRKRGFASADLIRHWADIVGPVFAGWTMPDKLTWPTKLEAGEPGFAPAVLTVACEGGRALLLQHEAPRLVERINATFGYGAIARIRIVQKPLPRPHRQPPPRLRMLSPAEEKRLAGMIGGVGDDGLRLELEKLGRALIGRPRRS